MTSECLKFLEPCDQVLTINEEFKFERFSTNLPELPSVTDQAGVGCMAVCIKNTVSNILFKVLIVF